MKIGNIVTDNEINEGNLFNIVKNLDEINNELPTLIIGWKKMKKYFPKHPILEEKINDDLFWTLSKFEDRNVNTINLEKFIQHSFNNKFSSFTFCYIDLINFSKSKIKKIINKIKNSEHIITYYNDNDILIFCDNILFSININVLIFLNINIEKLMDKINIISDTILPNKISSDFWKTYSERLYNDDSLNPVLYSFLKN